MSRSITALLEAAKFLDEQDKFRLSPQSAAAGGAVAADVGITFSQQQQQQQHFINGNGYGSSSKGIANNNINNNSASQLNRNNTTSAATIAAASAAAAASLAAAAAATTAAPANVNGHNGLSNGINAATSASLSNGHSSPRSQLIVAHDYEYVGSGAGTSSGAVAIRNGSSSEGRVNVSGEWRKEILKNNNKHTIRYIQTFPCSPIRIVRWRLFSHSPLCLFPCFDLVRRSSSIISV